MIEITLTSIIIALLVFAYLSSYHMNQERTEWAREREKLMKLFLAKDLHEVTVNEALEKEPVITDALPKDVVDIAEEDESVFYKAIQAQLKGENEYLSGTTEGESDS